MYHDTHPAVSLASRFTVAFMLMLAIALLIPWPFGRPEGQRSSPWPLRIFVPAQVSPSPTEPLEQPATPTPTPHWLLPTTYP